MPRGKPRFVKTDASGAVTQERPVCAFPRVARYKGSGDPNAASRYRCARATRLVPRQP